MPDETGVGVDCCREAIVPGDIQLHAPSMITTARTKAVGKKIRNLDMKLPINNNDEVTE
jgi:hypothetical protein